ncbi:MAG: hemerythrin-like metal-binding protein [Proteobacteria bacterium]|nr:hemerythrin-like metal-binding protein [Pseudomonadota bacterium]
MALLSWSNQYSIGDDLIDTEHEELFRLVNAFHDHWQEKRNQQSIAELLNQLITYAEMHFQHEEAIMLDAGFPRLAEHQQVHEAMVETIFKLRQSFEANDSHLEMNTMKFIKTWLLEHIIQNDYLFRDFLVRQKNSLETAAP